MDNLASLSASSDDPQKVMVACGKENQGIEGLVYRMATNVGDLESVNERFIRTAITL